MKKNAALWSWPNVQSHILDPIVGCAQSKQSSPIPQHSSLHSTLIMALYGSPEECNEINPTIRIISSRRFRLIERDFLCCDDISHVPVAVCYTYEAVSLFPSFPPSKALIIFYERAPLLLLPTLSRLLTAVHAMCA